MTKNDIDLIQRFINSFPKLNEYELFTVHTQATLTRMLYDLPIEHEYYKAIKKLHKKTYYIPHPYTSSGISYETHAIHLDGSHFKMPERPKNLPRDIGQKRFSPTLLGDYFMTRSHILASSLAPELALNPNNMFWGTEQLNGRYMNKIEQLIHQYLRDKRNIYYFVILVYINKIDTPVGVYQIIFDTTNTSELNLEYYYTANAQSGYNLDFIKHKCLNDPLNKFCPIVHDNKKDIKNLNKRIKQFCQQ